MRAEGENNEAVAAAVAAAAGKRSPNVSPDLKPNPCAAPQDLARLFATAYAAALPLDHPSVSPLSDGKVQTQRPSSGRACHLFYSPGCPHACARWPPGSIAELLGMATEQCYCRSSCAAQPWPLLHTPLNPPARLPFRHADLCGLPRLCVESGGCEVPEYTRSVMY